MSEQPDILAQMRGQTQEYLRNLEASDQRVRGMARRASRSAQEALDTQESYSKAARTNDRLRVTVASVSQRLEKMHIKGCLRAGYGCDACDALDEIADLSD